MMLIPAAVLILACCGPKPHEERLAFTARTDDYYQKFGISKSRIEPWEDAMRTTGGKGSYEWWYFDCTLKDGSTLVIAFHTKDPVHPDTPLEPMVTVDLTKPDGTSIHKSLKAGAGDFSAARDHCDVRVGANTFSGDLHDYTVHVGADELKADLRLHTTVPSWRPATGFMLFRHGGDEHYLAWLIAAPQGSVEGALAIDGQSREVTGVGYHDHNWGDASMLELVHDWYWGRAQIGSYCAITDYLTSAEKYGSTPIATFMLPETAKS